MRATMYGWLIVCPEPIGSGWSSYAWSCDPLPDERLARDGTHGGKHAWIPDVPAVQLGGDHPRPGVAPAGPGVVHVRWRQLAVGLSEGLTGLAEVPGDSGATDGMTVSTGVAIGFGVAKMSLMGPFRPRSSAQARITTNTPTVTITK